MKIKSATLLFLILCVFTACNNSDDVMDILTNKTWKLNTIFYQGKPDYSYWMDATGKLDKNALDESVKKNGEKGFVVTFDGARVGSVVSGTFSGQGYNSKFRGKWSADEDNRRMVITEYQVEGSDSDVLAKAFINGMKNVFSYRGNSDTNNLHLNFKEGELTKYMSFTILRE